jgi:hypothetical protein
MPDAKLVKFKDCEDGDLLFANGVIFQVTRSADVMESLAPDACVMVVKWHHPEITKWKVGDITVDYFDYDFQYLGKENNLESVVETLSSLV